MFTSHSIWLEQRPIGSLSGLIDATGQMTSIFRRRRHRRHRRLRFIDFGTRLWFARLAEKGVVNDAAGRRRM